MSVNFLLSEETVRDLASTLVHFLWQGTLLGMLTCGALHVLAPRRAQVRYAIHFGLLLLLVVIPVTTFLTLSADTSQLTKTNITQARFHNSTKASEASPRLNTGPGSNAPQRIAFVLRWLDRGQAWLVAGWFVGIAIFAIRLALGAIGIWRITRTRQALPPKVAAIADRLIQSMAFRVRPSVYIAEHISQAMALGVFKPMVLLPAAWVFELQPDMLEAVLAHELAHLRRWDLPINFLQRVVETLFFFHPVVWWCSRRMRIERELCCDERALQAIGDRVRYAEALTFLAEQRGSAWEPLLAAGIGGSKMALLERIRNVLGISQRAQGRFYGPTCALVGAAAASIAWLAILYATREQPVTTAKVDIPSTSQGIRDIGDARPEPTLSQTEAAARNLWPSRARSPIGAERASLPSENKMVTLPEYTIEPPDILWIEAIRVVPKSPHPIQTADVIAVQLVGGLPTPPAGGGPSGDRYPVIPAGRINLGAAYGDAGRVQVAGLTEDEAAKAIEESLRAVVKEPQVSVQLAQSAGLQPITGEHLVAPDGRVNLGTYGRVYLAGLKLDEARAAIERHLAEFLDEPKIFLSVFAYNSKVYYVVTEGQELGDTVARFPVTGNETVLDALTQVNGLSRIQDKRIWIARPLPGGAGCDAILPVNWQDITARGATANNYQVFPGDRIFVSAASPPAPSHPKSSNGGKSRY